MDIFVGFGYNENDKWIKEDVIPMITAFGINVVSGEAMEGLVLKDEVIERIKKADGLLAFLTRRKEMGPGTDTYITHRWVIEELGIAINNNIQAVEIREQKVDNQGGIAGAMQHVLFNIENKESLYLQLSSILNRWKAKHLSRRIQLLPSEIVTVIKPSMFPYIKCKYRYMVGNKEYEYQTTTLKRLPAGLCMDIQDIPSEDAFIEIVIQGQGIDYRTIFEPLYMKVMLQTD